MPFSVVLVVFIGGTPALIVLVEFMGRNLVHKISPWHTYPSCAWEALRRVESYQDFYKSLKKQCIESSSLTDGVLRFSAQNTFPELEKYGLLFPANPEHSAVDAPVFWHPNRFQNVVRFNVIPADEIDPKQSHLKLADFPAHRTHFRGADGAYHIRLLGEKFWFQLRCDNLDLESEEVYIGLDFYRMDNMVKRLETAQQIAGIYNGSIEFSAPLHTPKRPDLHRNSALVYDIRKAGGTWKDAINAHFGEDYLINNPDNFEQARTTVRNYNKRAESFIYGDYLSILDQT